MKPETPEISSRRIAAAIAFVAVLGCARLGAPQSAAAVFSTRCSSCHSFGKGDRVGPDLKGVTARRERSWLMGWIRSSAGMIRSADPVARALYKKYGEQRMPDFNLPVDQVAALIDYLASGGPDTDAGNQMREASTATEAELRLGQQLFEGQVALASGATACVSCHTVASRAVLGGTLGPDLTQAYAKYRDRSLHQYLQRTCLPSNAVAKGRNALTAAESLALRAFLRASDQASRPVALQSASGAGGQ